MKTTLLISLLFSLSSVVGQLSSISTEDSIKRLLIEPVPEYGIYPHPDPWPDPWGRYDLGLVSGTYVLVNWDPCGEKFHDNGVMSAKVPCVDDSPHGKAFYWDDKGIKTRETTYSNGYIYKEKIYRNGRINYLNHYNYLKGKQVKHGVCIHYDEYVKKTEHYKMGLKHGLFIEEGKGQTRVEQLYKEDKLVSLKYFHLNGEISYEAKYDEMEREVSLRNWNGDGVLTKEEFHLEGKVHGTWLQFDSSRNTKVIRVHENGYLNTMDNYKNDVKIAHRDYVKGLESYAIGWYEGGVKSYESFFESNGVDVHTLIWNHEGELTQDYQIKDQMYKGEGFYSLGTKYTFAYETAETPSYFEPLKIWYVIAEDTTKMLYTINSVSGNKQVLITNNYRATNSGFEKHGQWETYIGNYIDKVETWNVGKLEGRAVYYHNYNNNPTPYLIGHYKNNLRTKEWVEYLDSSIVRTSYKEGQKQGLFTKLNRYGDSVMVANYENDKLDGEYREFYLENLVKSSGTYFDGMKTGNWKHYSNGGFIQSEGIFLNNMKNGYWKFYSEKGVIKEEGNYENGERIGKWFYWFEDDKGVLKKKRIKSNQFS